MVQTYKQVGLGATPTSMQTHNPFGGERWTNSNLTTKESTLLNWVGKEKDNESKLGDHGVRKYEYETGRFISIDPLWGKYYGWTPYQYSMNSPVMLVDIDGLYGKKPNYFGELVEPATNDDFTFNNAVNGFVAGVANSSLFMGLGGDNLVPDYLKPFSQAGENFADYVSLASAPLGFVKNAGKKILKEGAEEVAEVATKGGGKFLDKKELAKRLGTTVNDYHENIKPLMKKDFSKEMKKLNSTNPDFSPNDLGNVMLKNPKTGKTINTNVPFNNYIEK